MSGYQTVRDLLQMIRFSHTVFALPFALLAAVMAWTTQTVDGETVGFSWVYLLGILICMIGARSAAMAFNRLVDRHLDAANPRTQQRHLPAGTLSVRTAVVFTLVSALIFIAGTTLFLPNVLPLILAIPVLLVLFGYSYTKRFTSLAHFWLGFSLMLTPVATWIALRGQEVMRHPADVIPAATLGLAVMLWVSGFDMIYACQDFAYDRDAKLKSIPVRLGIRGALRLAALCHVAMLVVLICFPWIASWAGLTLDLGLLYWLTLVGIGLLLAYQHWLVSPDDLTRVNIAFFNVNAIISFGLFVAGTVDLLLI